MNESKIFHIPEENFKKFEEEIAKLSRKSMKLIGEPIEALVFGANYKEVRKGLHIRFIEVVLNTPVVKLDGWEFVAWLDHEQREQGVIIRTLPGQTLPLEFRNLGDICQHCGINRFRRDTFVVRNIDTNEFKQVGRTCLKDFLGHVNSEHVAKLAQQAAYAEECANHYTRENEVGYERRNLSVMEFLAFAAMAVRLFGFTSTKNATDTIPSTAQVVTNAIIFGDMGELSPDDLQMAKDAQQWAAGLTGQLSDYLHNINVLAKSEYMALTSTGYVASIITAYQRNKQFEASQGEYVGSIGESVNCHLTLQNQNPFDGQYGTRYRIVFKDDNGNSLIWFTNKEMNITNFTRIDATFNVLKYSYYKGSKQTVITKVVSK